MGKNGERVREASTFEQRHFEVKTGFWLWQSGKPRENRPFLSAVHT